MLEGVGCVVWIPAFAGMTSVGWLVGLVHPHPGPLPEGEGIGG